MNKKNLTVFMISLLAFLWNIPDSEALTYVYESFNNGDPIFFSDFYNGAASTMEWSDVVFDSDHMEFTWKVLASDENILDQGEGLFVIGDVRDGIGIQYGWLYGFDGIPDRMHFSGPWEMFQRVEDFGVGTLLYVLCDFDNCTYDLDFMLTEIKASPVPEPATMLLFGLGLVGLAGVSRRKKYQLKKIVLTQIMQHQVSRRYGDTYC